MKSITERLQRDITYEGGSYPEPNEWKVSRENTGNMEDEIAEIKHYMKEITNQLLKAEWGEDRSIYVKTYKAAEKIAEIAIAAIKVKYE